MIRLEGVTKFFGTQKVVDDVSFSVNEGETAVLLGTSGCGKTTTLKIINWLEAASAGRVEIGGKDISGISPEALRRGIGYVIQNHGLFPHYTVAENIAIVPRLLKWTATSIESRVKELAGQLHLPEDVLQKYPQQLSGGQQQRVGLARALAADPPILFMDEPFGALDNITRGNIIKEFGNLEALKNKTIVLVTHDVREAFLLGDRILLMDRGKIVQQGSPTQLLFHPHNDFVKSFFDSQRMQYELEVATIADIWNQLPHPDNNARPAELSRSSSLWETLLKLGDQRDITILDADTAERRLASHAGIFKGLTELRANG